MFMRACLFKQQLNIIRTYSKPLKIQSSSIYGTENLNSFIAVPLTTDTDLYAPGCATQPSTGFSAYWLCCNDSALGLMKSWLCCGKGGRWGRRTLRLETGRESSTLILTVLILFSVREVVVFTETIPPGCARLLYVKVLGRTQKSEKPL